MGILDNKTRILDVVVTQEGRRQIASGKLVIEHASFSDSNTFYKADVSSGSVDASSRIFFEATSQFQDVIALEADDSGLLIPFPIENGCEIVNGGIMSGALGSRVQVTGSVFSSLSDSLMTRTTQNFSDLMILSTHDEIFDDSGFEIDTRELSFNVTEKNPLSDQYNWKVNVNDIDSLIEDQRFSHVENFMFLPPISKKDVGEQSKKLANYVKITPKEYDLDHVEDDLMMIQRRGLHKNVRFIRTSRNNRLLFQVFENNGLEIKKLEMYKFCSFVEKNTFSRSDVYFVGKMIQDQNGSYNFIHIFTLVFR